MPTDSRRIVRNRAKCNSCKQVVESHYRHDFKYCKCGNIFVDGGTEYIRRGWTPLLPGIEGEPFEELSEFSDTDQLPAKN